MLNAEGKVALISVFDSLTKIVSKDLGPHRHCLVSTIPKEQKFCVFNPAFLRLY